MTERPIPFSAPMVRALLAGTKTQTRRVVKPQPANDPTKHHPIEPYNNGRGGWNWVLAATGHGTGDPFPCPYGAPGDRLWVRESWRADSDHDDKPPRDIGEGAHVWYEADRGMSALRGLSRMGKLRPGMFMPRWASRITLEVTGVRVERLQEISEADARAEGAVGHPDGPWHAYRSLWSLINGPGSWDANPWVWVVEFKRLEG